MVHKHFWFLVLIFLYQKRPIDPIHYHALSYIIVLYFNYYANFKWSFNGDEGNNVVIGFEAATSMDNNGADSNVIIGYQAGTGGAGRANAITGTSVTYAGGGGGGSGNGTTAGGAGGSGGGGAGGGYKSPGFDGTDGLGSGGGSSGAQYSSHDAYCGKGGSGVIIVRYLIA